MIVVILDLSVAFDKVDHDVLLTILNTLASVTGHWNGSTATYG